MREETNEIMVSQVENLLRIKHNLASLLEGFTYSCASALQPLQIDISAVTADSRETVAGALFVALKGEKSDGHDYLQEVIANGCLAVIVEEGKGGAAKGENVCVIEVEDTRSIYAEVVASFFYHPAREMNFIGITGTNGKTTITYLLESIFERLAYSVGIIGTVNYRYRDRFGLKKVFPAPFTTPEPLILQKLLREMADEGVRYVVMEVSSHALAQRRLGDVYFDVAAFTNLSHDHLDYHQGMEEYFTAKTQIFSRHLKDDGSAVVVFGAQEEDRRNTWAEKMENVCRKQGVNYLKTVGCKGDGVELLHMNARLEGTTYTVKTPQGVVTIDSSLAGGFNVDNGMTAMAIALELGFDVYDVVSGLQRAKSIPGRLQKIHTAEEGKFRPSVFVDYAHTPDALEKVLQTLKELPHKELFCVFGCGGDRDIGKREVMGAIAAQLCDAFIITDDNPRTESPEIILQQISQGAKKQGRSERPLSWLQRRMANEKGFLVHGNRAEAIEMAIMAASAQDIVLIAGKGHEKYQITHEGKRFFDDSLEAGETLSTWTTASLNQALGIQLDSEYSNAYLGEVSTDSRSLKQDDIFVALKGENFDGHAYLQQAEEKGAGALIVEEHSQVLDQDIQIPLLTVSDTLTALGDLARYRRHYFRRTTNPIVVGITGSCGKTTVKEMTAAIFEQEWPDDPEVPEGRVLKTKGNFNNLIGLPLSLLPLSPRHQAAILEMGMNSPGEIAQLAKIADPDISCIVNIHGAHLEGLQSIEGVARAKEELFKETARKSTLVVNLDDKRVWECSKKYLHKKICFSTTSEGLAHNPDVWATDIAFTPQGGTRYQLHIGEKESMVDLHIPGDHNVANSLAAAAIAQAAGINIKTIAAGLKRFRAADKRMVMIESSLGYSIINDTYNANPGSMAAGLATLEKLSAGKRVAILGDMLELGKASREAHQELGRIAVAKKIDYLATTGEFSGEIVDGALSAGMNAASIKHGEDKEAIIRWVKGLDDKCLIQSGDVILVKASRGRKFETIVDQLVATL